MLIQIKKTAAVAVALSLVLLAGACSAPSAGSSQGTSASSVSSAAESAASQVSSQETGTAGTRTVTTITGEVEVPENPQRVVVQYLMGDVVTLGITPVGVSDVYDGAAFADLVSKSTGLGWFPEWEEESIMALDPDLILVIDEDSVEKYSKIAPTVLVPYGEITQDERVTFLGEVLNRQEEAKEAIQAYAVNLQEAKDKLQAAGFGQYTVSVFEGGADAAMSVKGDQYGTGSILYKELGLGAPKGVQENIIDKDSGGEQVSFEVLAEYTGDFIIRNTYEGMADLSEDAVWNSLPAVANGRVIGIEFGLSYYPDIYSAKVQMDFVTESLLALVE